jgi:hypothetical protein
MGLLSRRSAGAIIIYLVYTLLLPPTRLLAGSHGWFASAQPWIEYSYARSQLFRRLAHSAAVGHLGVSALKWLAPVRQAEVRHHF